MDWKKTFNFGLWATHAIFLIAILAALGVTIFALRLGQYQEAEESNITKLNNLIENFKTDDGFDKIAKYLSWTQSDKASEKINALSRQIAETEDLLEMKANPKVRESMRTFNRLISNTSGMSNPTDALKVLSSKVSSLSEMAKSQNYRNIHQIAEGMSNRLKNLNAKNVGGSVQVSYLKSDLLKLKTIVAKSALTEGEKAANNNRFDSMNNELELLSSLNSQSRDMNGHVTKASLALAEWMIDVEKRAAAFRTLRYQKQNKLIIMLAAVVGFLISAWMGLCYLFRWQKNKIGEQVELEVKSVIEKGILADQRFMIDHYSEITRDDIIRLLDELKVKLNLGSMLHSGLPFAGCMLDNSFRLTWHNQLFMEQFYLSEEEIKSDAFNWDYLRDFLNLEEDPIYEAMVNKIAGIYPVKIKQDELAPAQPYEMYVTPIFANREDRVMVFFYPLVSVKDAIGEQVNMATTTMARFVDSWNSDKLGEDELRLLEKDFKSNDLGAIFTDLSATHQRIKDDKDECVLTIRSLEKENDYLAQMVENLQVIEAEKREIIKKEFILANDLRISFINTLEKCESLGQINKSIMQQNDDLKNEAMKMHQINTEIAKRNKETLDILSQLDGVRTDYKKLKFELLEVKTRLITMNSNLFGQLPPLEEPLQRLASKYKDELARLEVAVSTLDKKIGFSDMLTLKLNMIHEKQNFDQINFQWQTTQKDHEMREVLLSIQKSLGMEENKIIENLTGLSELMKKDFSKVQEAQQLASIPMDSSLS